MTPTVEPAGVSEAEWRGEAEKTLDHLSRFLQKIGAPHAVDWRTWIDNAEQQLAEMRGAVNAARDYISKVPHGDNCYLSNNYEGDPGAGCNCGKESMVEYLAALAPTSQPSRGKCPTCGGRRYIERALASGNKSVPCPDCKCTACDGSGSLTVYGMKVTCGTCCGKGSTGENCAQPERQGVIPEILNELIGEGKYRYNLNDDQISALRELIKPSPPPTDDIVAGLRAARDRLAVRSFKIEADSVDRAIAALETRK